MKTWKLILVLFLFAVMFGCVKGCLAQDLREVKVICVAWPVGNSNEAVTGRYSVSRELEKLGFATADCVSNPAVAYDVQLWFYPYGGVIGSGEAYFYSSFVIGDNSAVGVVSANSPSVRVSYWMIELWPRGKYRTIYRDAQASSLEQGLKHLQKAWRKAYRQKRK